MATQRAVVSSYLVPSANVTKNRTLMSPPPPRSSLSSSSVSVLISSPSKPTRRKNSLRPKLLKTLPKPYTTRLLSQEPTQSSTSPFDSDDPKAITDQNSRDCCSIASGAAPLTGAQVTTASVAVAPTGDSAILAAGSESLSSGSVLKFGLWLVGMFVFQTVCAVWVLGSSKLGHQYGNFEDADDSMVSLDGKKKKARPPQPPNGLIEMPLFGNSELMKPPADVVSVFETRLEAKIDEIRAMAREVRESERKELNAKHIAAKTDGVGEVNDRLDASQKRLDSVRDKSLVSMISYLSRPERVEDSKKTDSALVKQANKALMVEKRNKFKSPPVESRDKPKGFGGLDENSDSIVENFRLKSRRAWKSNSMALEEEKGGMPVRQDPKSLQVDWIKLHNDKESAEVGGVDQETSDERCSIKGEEEAKIPSLEETQVAKSSKKGGLDSTQVSNKSVRLIKSSSLQRNGVQSKSEIKKVMNNQSRVTTDAWWMNLQYVLAVNIRRGPNPDSPEGLFTLTASSAEDRSEQSYVICFEDHNDAANFCYILESFFEDLEDFVADVVLLPIKDLDERKVIAVKKRQIQMYAGQPLEDVEMALRALMIPHKS